jgi:RES domain-containing protein
MLAFRIADRRFPIFSGQGASRTGARWNSPGQAVIYAAATYAGAVLEVLVHSQAGMLPREQAVVEIKIPESIAIETLYPAKLQRWNETDMEAARAFGDAWCREQRTAVLLVPSMVTQGREFNVVINPSHRDFRRIRASAPQPVNWDARLFRH